ncbi:MAG: [FeFe] hydrogenase H-cluster radical SAM maturase HydE [Treponemataceae bacterium]|nr:[FeFe] hydrogenase H-cluster radical SAM maturase HydE [Treponemataceae bacterium]
MKNVISEIEHTRNITREQLEQILAMDENLAKELLYPAARKVADRIYGNKVFTRGLIEFTNYCRNDCYYCGIRCSNRSAQRYRLTKEEILDCCKEGYELGFRTFVLQGGEDMSYSDEDLCSIISSIRAQHPDCAITLSIGERERKSYQQYYDAGANRYLLRHETADEDHYRQLHPENLSLEHRMNCLRELRDIGYQVGCGFMVGSPGQTVDTLYKDLQFIKELQPHMVGIGPFIPAAETPFAGEKPGTLEQTLRLLAVIRLIHPKVLLPATTALGTIHPQGRELGILAGANVVMPNLSPVAVRKKYALYDNKICTGEEAAECRGCLGRRVMSVGCELAVDRGDSLVQ